MVSVTVVTVNWVPVQLNQVERYLSALVGYSYHLFENILNFPMPNAEWKLVSAFPPFKMCKLPLWTNLAIVNPESPPSSWIFSFTSPDLIIILSCLCLFPVYFVFISKEKKRGF